MRHNQIFGKALRRIRREMQLSQEELSFRAEISKSYISLLELGQRSPTLDSLSKISFGLKMELGCFLTLLAEEIRQNAKMTEE